MNKPDASAYVEKTATWAEGEKWGFPKKNSQNPAGDVGVVHTGEKSHPILRRSGQRKQTGSFHRGGYAVD